MKNKLIPAILIGATVGAGLSLIDRGTRESVSSCSKDLKYYAQHPDEVKNKFNSSDTGQTSKVNALRDEVMFWKDTIEEIRHQNPELEKSVMDAKDTFVQKREQKHLN